MAAPPDAVNLDAWVLETAPRAMAYARSLLRSPEEAEDIVHDCYCRLIARRDVYDLPRDGLKLLLTAISNACINQRTRRRPMFRLSFGSSAEDERQDDPPDPRSVPPDQRLEYTELSEAVAAGLQQLPPQQRAALELKALGHSQQEIAEILDTTPTNVGVLVHRGRQRLAEWLGPHMGGDAS